MFSSRTFFLFALVLFAVDVLPAEVLAGTRIAILGDLGENLAEIDTLTESLSKEPGVELVERTDIDKIITEQKLSLLGVTMDDAIKAGALLGAKGVIIIKSFEWAAKFQHGLYPNAPHLATLPPGEQVFFGLYFVMTVLHGLHVIAGMAVLTWILRNVAKD